MPVMELKDPINSCFFFYFLSNMQVKKIKFFEGGHLSGLKLQRKGAYSSTLHFRKVA